MKTLTVVKAWRTGIVIAALGLLLAVGAGTALAGAAVHQSVDVTRFDGLGGDVGDASLVRTNSGVSMTIKSSIEGELFVIGGPGLNGNFFNPGDATTNWWVIFNEPGNCVGGCGEDDVLNSLGGGPLLDAEVDVIFATGHVAGSKWRAAAHLSEGDTKGSLRPLFGAAPIGLIDAMTAEIHVVVRSHGPAKDIAPGQLDDAISTVFGGCLGFGGTFDCGDSQAAEFPVP